MNSERHTLSRRSFLGLQAAALAYALSACASHDADTAVPATPDEPAAPRTVDEIRASGKLRVGIHSDNKPLGFVGTNGYYIGIDGYFCIYLPYKIGIGIEYVAIDPHERYDLLASHAIDLALGEMSPADERSGEVMFTRPLYRLELGIASPSGAPIESIDQLAGKELIVCEGTFAAQYARTTWPEVTLRPYQTFTDSYTALKNGKGAALLDDEINILAWTKSNGGFTLSMRDLTEPRLIAPAVAADQEDLRNLIDNAASDFISSGYSKKGYEKYVKPTIAEDYSTILCNNDYADAIS